jgi:hypothetical protein
MSNVIELNFAEIETVVGGVDRSPTPSIPNKTAMAVPNMSAYSARPTSTYSSYNASDLQKRLEAL